MFHVLLDGETAARRARWAVLGSLLVAGLLGGATGSLGVFLFALVGVYLYFGALSVATGGKPVPMGRPILYG